MKPTLPTFVTILERSNVPERLQHAIIPAFQRSDKREKPPTLLQVLEWRKTQRDVTFTEEKQAALAAGRSISADVVPWPSNLRLEPFIPRSNFAHVQSDIRQKIKEAMKER